MELNVSFKKRGIVFEYFRVIILKVRDNSKLRDSSFSTKKENVNGIILKKKTYYRLTASLYAANTAL